MSHQPYVEIRNQGDEVEVRIQAYSAELAAMAYLGAAREAPMEGYRIACVRISQRPRGGRARVLAFVFKRTDFGMEPELRANEWRAALAEVASIADGRQASSTTTSMRPAPRLAFDHS